MQTDIGLIRYNNEAGLVTLPVDVWNEVVLFCRRHGETDLPSFPAPIAIMQIEVLPGKRGGFVMLDSMPSSGSQW